LYRAAGCDVALVPWREDGRSMIQKVESGGLCLGSSEDNLVVAAIARGHALKVVGAMFREPPLVLMTRRGSGIRAVSELRGRRVAMHYDGIRILEIVLALEGIPRDALTIDEVAFDADNIARYDAVQGYAMTEPIELMRRGIDVELIPVQHADIKPYAQVMFATDECLRTHGDAIARVVAATDQGWRMALEYPDLTAELVAEMMGDRALWAAQLEAVRALPALVLGTGANLEAAGRLDPDQWRRNLETYWRFAVIRRQVRLDEVLWRK
jgi:ABC-type nitrate/sulfonate/bicarbonate transport system substrate-binding protein